MLVLRLLKAFGLSAHHSPLASAGAAKDAVKADQKAWDAKLEARLQRALDIRDSRESWAVCRQLAGHGPSKVHDRVVPAARLITRAHNGNRSCMMVGVLLSIPSRLLLPLLTTFALSNKRFPVSKVMRCC